MSVTGIFDFNRIGARTYDEANGLAAIIRKFTNRYSVEVNQKINQLEAFGPNDKLNTARVEDEVGKLIEEWNGKVKKLGGVPKGLWIVDIDCGDGYYCWKFPESNIGYWHDYNSGYTGRIPLEERAKIKGHTVPEASTSNAEIL